MTSKSTVSLEELRLDAKDLEHLIGISTRKNNQLRLRGLLSEVNAKISVAVVDRAEQQQKAKQQQQQQQEQQPEQTEGGGGDDNEEVQPDNVEELADADEDAADAWAASAPAAALPVAAGAFVPIQSFGWDQSDKFVSVYVSEHMHGVKASGAKVDCDFNADSFDLKVNEYVERTTTAKCLPHAKRTSACYCLATRDLRFVEIECALCV